MSRARVDAMVAARDLIARGRGALRAARLRVPEGVAVPPGACCRWWHASGGAATLTEEALASVEEALSPASSRSSRPDGRIFPAVVGGHGLRPETNDCSARPSTDAPSRVRESRRCAEDCVWSESCGGPRPSMQPSALDSAVVPEIGKYHLVAELARGGMGDRPPRGARRDRAGFNKLLVVKELKPELSRDDGVRRDVPRRGAPRRAPHPPQHRADHRGRLRGDPPLHGHGVPRRALAPPHDPRASGTRAASRSARTCASSPRRCSACTTRTSSATSTASRSASCTATSARSTSSSPSTGRPR